MRDREPWKRPWERAMEEKLTLIAGARCLLHRFGNSESASSGSSRSSMAERGLLLRKKRLADVKKNDGRDAEAERGRREARGCQRGECDYVIRASPAPFSGCWLEGPRTESGLGAKVRSTVPALRAPMGSPMFSGLPLRLRAMPLQRLTSTIGCELRSTSRRKRKRGA